MPRREAARAQAIELLAEGAKNHAQVAREVKVTDRALRFWLTEREFIDAVFARSRQMLRNYVPVVYRVLTAHAIKGEPWAVRLMLEHIEALEALSRNTLEGAFVVQWSDQPQAGPTEAAESDE